MIYSGSRMIYSGSQSSFEFFEILIKAKNPDPCGSNPYYLSIVFLEIMKNFTFNQKEKSTGTNYLPFFMSYYSPAVHTVQNSQAYNHFREIGTILVYLVFNFFVDPDPEQQFRILIQAKVSNPCGCGTLFLST